VGASGDLGPLAHLALVLVGEGECLHEGRRVSGAQALRAAASPARARAEEGLALINGTQAHDRGRRTGGGRGAAARPLRPTSSERSPSTPSRALTSRSIPRSTPRAPPRPGRLPPANLRRLLRQARFAESHRDCVGCRTPTASADDAGPRRRARRAEYAPGRTRRDELATDNPMVFAETGGDPLRRQLPRPARGDRGGPPRDRRRRARRDQRASHGAPRQPVPLGPAALWPARETSLGPDDGARDGGRARLGEQGARPPGERRLHPDLRGQGGPRCPWARRRLEGRPRRRNTSRVLAVELLAACEALDFRRPLRSSAALERSTRGSESACHPRHDRVSGPNRGPRGAPPARGRPRRGRARLDTLE